MSSLDDLIDWEVPDLKELSRDEKEDLWGRILAMCQVEEHLDTTTSRVAHIRTEFVQSSAIQCPHPDMLRDRLSTSTGSHDRLKLNIREAGLEVFAPTPSDGNCFFAAVVSQLRRLGVGDISHQKLRVDVVNSIRNAGDIEGLDGHVQLSDFMTSGVDAYCDKMCKGGEWADHVAVVATARYLKMDIMIVTSSPDSGPDNTVSWITGQVGYKGDPLLLGHVWENHYLSLCPKGYVSRGMHNSATTVSHDENLVKARDEDPKFTAYILDKYCKKDKKVGPVAERIIKKISTDIDEEAYMASYLQEIHDAGQGYFYQPHNCARDKAKQFFCERHRKPRGKKIGPHDTRCNGCPAYISFRFVEGRGSRGVIIRRNMTHEGHNLSDPSEKHVALMDGELVAFIESRVLEGDKPAKVLTKCIQWARERGHNDFHDRRFIPTLRDVQQVANAFVASRRIHQVDSVAVDILCTEVLKDAIVYYQPLDETESQPLIIVYQSEQQFVRMAQNGERVVFLDATYKGITAYGFAFYCLAARDEKTEKGTPLLYIISSDDSIHMLEKGLTVVKERAEARGIHFYPRSFMVDKDTKEHTAILNVFPLTQILLCWFHVLQAIYRWLNKHGSGVSGNMYIDERKRVVEYVRKLKDCTEERQFQALVGELEAAMPTPAVAQYLETNWVPCCSKWANFGRRFHHADHDTNNLVERFFLSLKYHHLAGQCNRRVESLLILLAGEVDAYYDSLDGLYAAKRMGPGKNSRAQARTQGKVQLMLDQNWKEKVTWETDTQCLVPSQEDQAKVYRVDLTHGTCECIASTQHGHCKHYQLASVFAAERGLQLTQVRRNRAIDLYQGAHYIEGVDTIEVFDDDIISFVIINKITGSMKCTCVAFSHGLKCICLQVAEMVQPKVTPCPSPEASDLEDSPPKPAIVSKPEVLGKQLNDIAAAVKKNPNNPLLKKAKAHINTAHKIVFGTYQHASRKKKHSPLHPSRKLVKIAKTRTGADHVYASEVYHVKKTTRMEDGGFRMANRNVQTVREPFSQPCKVVHKDLP